MKLYSTVSKEASAEQIIEKSRFIAYVKPVSTKEEADAFITSIKKKHRDATHNVPALVLGDKFQIQWASDDGEPQGTSGAPIVQMLVSQGITNVVVVVTRYFGGIKLGTGGLVRAYTGSAKLGVEAAGICDVKKMCKMTVSMDYTYLTKFQNMAAGGEFTVINIDYTDVVHVSILMTPENEERVPQIVANLTGGKGTIISKEYAELSVEHSIDPVAKKK